MPVAMKWVVTIVSHRADKAIEVRNVPVLKCSYCGVEWLRSSVVRTMNRLIATNPGEVVLYFPANQEVQYISLPATLEVEYPEAPLTRADIPRLARRIIVACVADLLYLNPAGPCAPS